MPISASTVRKEPPPLFVSIGHAVAQAASGFRPGARHVVVILIGASDADAAGAKATNIAEKLGWSHMDVDEVGELDLDAELIDNDALREAIEVARLSGHCLAVGVEEVPLDS